MAALLMSLLPATEVTADSIRIAAYNASLTRDGPGLLLKDLLDRDDAQIAAVVEIIQRAAPDILLINEFDYDFNGEALSRFRSALGLGSNGAGGLDLAHAFAAPVNAGLPSGHDLDGDGKTTGWRDSQGFGKFTGQQGMVLLSRYPILTVRSFQTLLWRDAPGARMPVLASGGPFPDASAQSVMRLSSKSHWDVKLAAPTGDLHIFASHPTPPVFDGPEDLNGLRNRDEIGFWVAYLNGVVLRDDDGTRAVFEGGDFAILGTLNADPHDGDGLHDGIRALLGHPAVADPLPTSTGAARAAADQGGWNERHRGDAAHDTVDWDDGRGPGNLRVDYVLPAAALNVVGAGVFWPEPEDPLFRLIGAGGPVASDHRLVWIDVSTD